jgi:hypothetical protein
MNMVLKFRRLFLPMLLLLVTLFAACDQSAVAPPVVGGTTVSGTLVDSDNNMIPEGIVEAIDAQGTTIAIDTADAAGGFTLVGIPENPDGIQVKVSRADIPIKWWKLKGIIGEAGGHTGVKILVDHGDSCCATINLTITSENHALGGVEVRLRRGATNVRTAVSDVNGRVTFHEVCDGEFNVRLAKEGYAVVERGDIKIEGCHETNLEYAMVHNANGGGDDTCCRGVLHISVRDSANNAAINGAEVRITRTGAAARTLKTENGSVTFHEVCRGTYNVRIAKEGYRVVEYSVEVGCNGEVTSERTMAAVAGHGDDTCCNGRLYVIVRDSATNAAIANSTVRLYNGATLVATATSNANGAVVFEHLCPGNHYSISGQREGYSGREANIEEMGCNQTREVTLRLPAVHANADTCCNGRLYVIARDSTTNAVIANATVKLWQGGVLKGTATTNANGAVVFEHVCQGSYGLDVSRDGYTHREGSVTMGCNQIREITYKLLSTHNTECCTASLALRVKDSTVADGGWMTGVTVDVKRGNTSVAHGTTNADGRYTAEQLCGHETYTVTFSKDGFVSRTLTFTYGDCVRKEETVKLSPR